MPADFDLQAFDPEAHGGLVYGDFLSSLRSHWPWREIPGWRLRERLVRELARPGTVAYVISPKGMPGKLIGAIAARPHERVIVWACVRHHYRRMGVATSAAEALGIDFAPGGNPAPVGLVFWTYAAARIVARGSGYLLFHDCREFDDDDGEASTSRVQGERPRPPRDAQGDPGQ
jgi:hypothetical protein